MLTIRKVQPSDSDLILHWRNNPEVYKYALTPEPVKKIEHINWFNDALASSRCVFYMGSSNGVLCGTVRYQLTEDMMEAEVSISISPEFWGKGIASQMMQAAEEALKKETSVRIIHATVLNENIASIKLFERASFEPVLTKFKKCLNR